MEGDRAFQLAISHHYLGRIHLHAGRSDLALEPLQQAIRSYETQGKKPPPPAGLPEPMARALLEAL